MKVAPNRKHEPKMSEAVLRQAGDMRGSGKYIISARNVDRWISKEQICSSLAFVLGFLGAGTGLASDTTTMGT